MKILLTLSFLILLACNANKQAKTQPMIDSTPVPNAVDTCFGHATNCGAVDSEKAEAEKAYIKGCEANDYYACYRLGQFQQFSKQAYDDAMVSYKKACDGKDSYGCEGIYSLTMELCFDKQMTKYCGDIEPRGEYRIIAYLLTFHPKYENAFTDFDFSYSISNKRANELFHQFLKQKDSRLLSALYAAQRNGKHDGASAEGLQSLIRQLEGKE